MGPGLEDDLLVLRERLIDVHIEPIEVAEGGIAPNSQSGNRPVISSSVASRT
jgi:hypothetical protein